MSVIGARRNRPSPRPRCAVPVESIAPNIRKEDAPCCAATLDEHGRYCIGFCGPDCIRRPR